MEDKVWTCWVVITVSNVSDYDLDGRFSISGGIFLFFHTFRPIQWLLEALSHKVKKPERGTDLLASYRIRMSTAQLPCLQYMFTRRRNHLTFSFVWCPCGFAQHFCACNKRKLWDMRTPQKWMALFNVLLSPDYIASYGRTVNWKGCERKQSCGLIQSIIPAFAWMDCGKPRKSSVSITEGPRFEPGTAWMRSRSLTHFTATFNNNRFVYELM
jgi:hypothetical protein